MYLYVFNVLICMVCNVLFWYSFTCNGMYCMYYRYSIICLYVYHDSGIIVAGMWCVLMCTGMLWHVLYESPVLMSISSAGPGAASCRCRQSWDCI